MADFTPLRWITRNGKTARTDGRTVYTTEPDGSDPVPLMDLDEWLAIVDPRYTDWEPL